MAVVLALHDAFPFQYRIQVLARFHAYAVQLCQRIESVLLDKAQKVFQQIDVILPEPAQDSLSYLKHCQRRRQHFQVFNGDAPLLERYNNPHRSTVDVPFGQKRPAVPVSHPNRLKLLPFLRHGIPIVHNLFYRPLIHRGQFFCRKAVFLHKFLHAVFPCQQRTEASRAWAFSSAWTSS